VIQGIGSGGFSVERGEVIAKESDYSLDR
jgi:hypothetical protein